MTIAVIPDPLLPSQTEAIRAAAQEAGATLGESDEANALIWLPVGKSDELRSLLASNLSLRWVQLPWAGVDAFDRDILRSKHVTFTCAKGAYQGEVSSHALLLTLACLRNLGPAIRNKSWCRREPHRLNVRRVTIVGGGGLTEEYLRLLKPFDCETRVVRRKAEPISGASSTHSSEELPLLLPTTDVLVLTLALTQESRGIIGFKEFALLPEGSVLINVARGRHVDTDALVEVLQSKRLAGAGLDVTDPEPLPDGHPLWNFDNVIITSHSANSTEYTTQQLAKRVYENVTRYLQNEPLIGVIDPAQGY